jgi:hypothetical protein
MTISKARIAVCAATIFASCFVVGCSTSAPTASPTAIRLIAGTYHYLIKSGSCPDVVDLPISGRTPFSPVALSDGLGPVQLSQIGSIVKIDSHQARTFGRPIYQNLQLSGTISGATLSVEFSADETAGLTAEKADGRGIIAIDSQSISGRFSGTTSYLTLELNFPYGAFVPPCSSDDHSIVLTRVS